MINLLKLYALPAVALCMCLGGAGCKTHPTTNPLSAGYEEVSHPYHTLIDEPPPPRVSLQYRDAQGVVTPIWPAVYGGDEVIHDKTIIFVAQKAYMDPDRVTHPRLFAANAPDLPLDLTDEVLWRWSQVNHRNFPQTLRQFEMITPAEAKGGLQLNLEFWGQDTLGSESADWPPESSLWLSWEQVADIMRAVKTKGVMEKDLRWHTPHIGEKY
jgi:hypothetical protein